MQLSISSVTRRYGAKLALNNFSAVLKPGVYDLLGLNGAGKARS